MSWVLADPKLITNLSHYQTTAHHYQSLYLFDVLSLFHYYSIVAAWHMRNTIRMQNSKLYIYHCTFTDTPLAQQLYTSTTRQSKAIRKLVPVKQKRISFNYSHEILQACWGRPFRILIAFHWRAIILKPVVPNFDLCNTHDTVTKDPMNFANYFCLTVSKLLTELDTVTFFYTFSHF